MNPIDAAQISEEDNDVISRRIWFDFDSTNFPGVPNELPLGFTIGHDLQKQLILPLSANELLVLDPFASLRTLDASERRKSIDKYWKKNSQVGIAETVLNVLLVTLVTWTMGFIFALGLRVLFT